MKINLTYNMGDTVILKVDTMKKIKALVIGATVYADGGFQYKLTWMNEEGELRDGSFFETEIEEIYET